MHSTYTSDGLNEGKEPLPQQQPVEGLEAVMKGILVAIPISELLQ